MKINNDKYYTSDKVVMLCLKQFINTAIENDIQITETIEPSAGSGAFSSRIQNCIAYDIEPESENIIKQDFLTLDIPYKKGRLIIGNPPFGKSNSLSVKFFKKSVEIADYIAFIQPISQLNNTLQMYEFDLIKSIDLGETDFSDRKLHCCFNIYKRPDNGILNIRPNYKLEDVTILEYRRGGKYIIPNGYDYAMCNWGNGSLGKQPIFVGEFAQEVYVYIKNEKFREEILRLLQFDTIRDFVKSVSTKSISVMRLYKYLSDNIDGIK